jgi:hypothetical protein
MGQREYIAVPTLEPCTVQTFVSKTCNRNTAEGNKMRRTEAPGHESHGTNMFFNCSFTGNRPAACMHLNSQPPSATHRRRGHHHALPSLHGHGATAANPCRVADDLQLTSCHSHPAAAVRATARGARPI